MNVTGITGASLVQHSQGPCYLRTSTASVLGLHNLGAAEEPDEKCPEIAAQQAQVVDGPAENQYAPYIEFKRSSVLDALSIAIMGLNTEKLVSIQTQLNLEFPLAENLLVTEVACYAKLLSIKLKHYYYRNQSALLERANDHTTLTPEQKEAIQLYHEGQIHFFAQEHSDEYNQLIMPMALGVVIAESLGIKQSDIQMTLVDSNYCVVFPPEKLIHLRAGAEELSLDERLGLDMELDESLSTQRITIETLRALHKNIYQHGMGHEMIPLFGASQSGKSTLLNLCLGVSSPEAAVSTRSVLASDDEHKKLRTRVGNGGQSKTSLYYQRELPDHGYVADTPGLGDTRGVTTALVIHYQLVELLMSNKLKKIVWTLTKADFMPPLTNNGIRSMMDFFDRPFDIKEIGGGFYNSLFDAYFNSSNSVSDEELKHSVSDEEIEVCLSGFLNNLEANVNGMETSPFMVVIRDNDDDLDEDEKLTKEKLEKMINRNLHRQRKTVLEALKESEGFPTPNIQTSLLYMFYLLLIKKDMVIGNLGETNEDLRAKMLESAAFDFNAIKKKPDHLNNDEETLKNQIGDVVKPYMDMLNAVKDREKKFQKNISDLESSIHTLAALESDYDPHAMKKDIRRLNDRNKELLQSIEGNRTKINELESDIEEYDTNDRVDKNGFPKPLKAKSHLLWNYIEYVESGCDPASLTFESNDLAHLTKTIGSNYLLYRYNWIRPGGLDYKGILHNYTTKKERHKTHLEGLRASLKKEYDEYETSSRQLEENKVELERLEDVSTSKPEKIKGVKKVIKLKQEELCELATAARESYEILQQVHTSDLSILHDLLSDSKLTYLEFITNEYRSSFVEAFRGVYIES